MTELIRVLAGGFVVVFAAWMAGRVFGRRLAPSLSFGIGAIALSYTIFLLMLLRRAGRIELLLVLIGAVAAGFGRGIPRLRFNLPSRFVLIISTPFFVWYAVNTLAPEVQADPNVYHLQPAIDSREYGGFSGKISFYERLPHSLEMLYVPAWRIGGASAAKLVHFAFLLATLPVMVLIARRLGLADSSGQAAAAMYFLVPIVAVAGTAAFNDAALAYCTVAAVMLALDEEPIYAGLLAGFCYAIKMTGALAIPIALTFFLARRQWRSAGICLAAAVATSSPWLIRNAVETGNPFAPFFNQWFPNPFFYAATERELMQSLRSYGISFWQRFPELLWGTRLQGMIGPAFLVTLAVFLSLRRKASAILIGVAAALSVSWWTNAGARFLLPALPFLALAISASLPTRGMMAVLTIHALTCFPPILFRYNTRTFQIATFPWRAALRIESEETYLARTSEDYQFAKMAETNTPATARILDLHGIHAAHVKRHFYGSWMSAAAVRATDALRFAERRDERLLVASTATFSLRPICGFRLTQTAQPNQPWTIHEIEVAAHGVPVESGGWTVSAPQPIWDAPRAFDRNPVSRWMTSEMAQSWMAMEVTNDRAAQADWVRVVLPAASHGIQMRLDVCSEGSWSAVPLQASPSPEINLRAAAIALLKKEGFTHIVAPVGLQGVGVLGEKLVNQADDWNLEVVNNLYTIYVLKIR